MNEDSQPVGLTSSGIALVVTQLFRLIFGGYLIAFDQFYYNDLESASTVLVLYVIIGIFTALFLMGRKYGLTGLIAITAILVVMQSIYIVVFFSQTTIDPSLHDPVANWWATMLYYVFALLTFVFAFKVLRETSKQK